MRLINADKVLESVAVDPFACPGCPEPEELAFATTLIDAAEKATVDELKEAAKEMGYKLIPMPSDERLKACTCGCRRREHWYTRHGVRLMCVKCGKEAVGETEADAKRNWNSMIEAERRDNETLL